MSDLTLVRTVPDRIIEITLNSFDATELDSSPGKLSNLVWTLSPPITLLSRRFRVQAHSGLIPRSAYLINAANNTFTVTIEEPATVFTNYLVTLTQGNFNSIDFTPELKSQMDSATGKSFTITYTRSLNAYTFALAQGSEVSMTMSFGTSTSYIPLGFTNETQTFSLAGGTFSLASNRTVDMNTTPSVEIHMKEVFFSDSYSRGQASGMLRKVYYQRGFNAIEILEPGEGDWKEASVGSKSLDRIHLWLLDNRHRFIDLRGGEWEITIRVEVLP